MMQQQINKLLAEVEEEYGDGLLLEIVKSAVAMALDAGDKGLILSSLEADHGALGTIVEMAESILYQNEVRSG